MSKQPNVVVFFTDQQRWDSTGVHGCPLDLTPNFDAMAREGTHLYNTTTCQPVCGPARGSWQTGQYASTHGVYHNGLPIPQTQETLAHCFRRAGYQTGYIGKWHLAERNEVGPVAEQLRGGYEYWLASNVLEFTSNAYQTVLYDNDGQPHDLPGYRVDALTDAAIRYIDSHREAPFFLYISYIEPHHQNHIDDYPPPVGYRDRYTGRWTPPDLAALGGTSQQHLAGYYGMIKRLDEALGRLRDCLISRGLLDDTIMLYSTDHGSHFKTRNSEYKRCCHEAAVRIPTAITGPGFDGGGQIRQQVSLVDLPATLVDAAGLEVPESFQGRSVCPLVRGDREGWPEESFIQISESHIGRAIRNRRWKYSVGAVDPDWKTCSSQKYQEQFLYDLDTDPYELCNLVASAAHEPIRNELRERLVARMVEVGEKAPTIVPADDSQPAGQRHMQPDEATDPSAYRAFHQMPPNRH